MDNGSGETVQDAQRGQNRQAEPGGEYFVYFWTGRAAPPAQTRAAPVLKNIFFIWPGRGEAPRGENL
ncbi:hypothetical protein CI753_00680 [Klebsiella pneumoniae subsp. pneumoniae]|nr:hypothetical protein CI753_00680 [Klebsiella pneumoniae subsp. pneumoniae]